MQKSTISNGDIADLIKALERAWELALDLDIDGEDAIYELLLAARGRALWRLADCGGLLGSEYCNHLAEVKGTVAEVIHGEVGPLVVYRRAPGSQSPIGTEKLSEIACDHFFRVPGSEAVHSLAIAELLRQPAKQRAHA